MKTINTLQEACNSFYSQMDRISVLTDEEKKQLGYLLNKVHLWACDRADMLLDSMIKEIEK